MKPKHTANIFIAPPAGVNLGRTSLHSDFIAQDLADYSADRFVQNRLRPVKERREAIMAARELAEIEGMFL